MSARKVRKSVPVSTTVSVNTREVNVAVEGLDPSAITSSFTVHLLKNGQRIASRFFLQPSTARDAVEANDPNRFAHFDFVLPIDIVADGKLGIEIEQSNPNVARERSLSERTRQATLSVYLMLESE